MYGLLRLWLALATEWDDPPTKTLKIAVSPLRDVISRRYFYGRVIRHGSLEPQKNNPLDHPVYPEF
jgi:hypothetical protein